MREEEKVKSSKVRGELHFRLRIVLCAGNSFIQWQACQCL